MKLSTTHNDLTLSAVARGERVRLQSIVGGHELLSRLASLGFTPGAWLSVVQNRGRGPIIVELRGTRVALGRGEATRIVVERQAGGSHVR
ncbi:MAG: FeoA domain-containing protein [Anaerolineae bacterium]|nr:FeoA domain-containing protein [Anaerolineae bacterium]